MTSSCAPLDLSLASVRSAEHRQSQQPADGALQMLSRQLDKAACTRRGRRGRRRPPPARAPPPQPPPSDDAICTQPSAAAAPFSDCGLSRHCGPPVFAQLDSECPGEDKNKSSSWRMDEDSTVSAVVPDDCAAVLPYGRRGKTG